MFFKARQQYDLPIKKFDPAACIPFRLVLGDRFVALFCAERGEGGVEELWMGGRTCLEMAEGMDGKTYMRYE